VADPRAIIEAASEPRRSELRVLYELVREAAPGMTPHVDGKFIGFGRYQYRYASGREGEASVVALANNKGPISLYLSGATDDGYVAERWAPRLGKVSVGKSCIRIARTADVDLNALRQAIRESVAAIEARYPIVG
jgi:hypothetical protein